MSPQRLAGWHRAHPGRVAGSVYAAEPGQRVVMARELNAAGLVVHVDMIAAERPGAEIGVSAAELRDICAAVPDGEVEVHLIGPAEFVDERLPLILQCRPARVFLPWAVFIETRVGAVRSSGAGAWITVWDEWTGEPEPSWPTRPDGVLVMLIAPGTRDTALVGRLAVVSACAPVLPVAVDGGVTEHLAPLCISAGARSIVVGRALLTEGPMT